MTVVIGAVAQGNVYLAGDSFCGDDEVQFLCSEAKVLKVHTAVGFGLCGGTRSELYVVNSVKNLLKNKKVITDKFLRTDFCISLYDSLKSAGVLRDTKGVHNFEDSDYIVAHEGHLYYLDVEIALWEPRHPYLAIGAGRSLALGALAYAHESGDLERDPEGSLNRIMNLCSTHSPWVSPPFTIIKI